jgi:hypothetical protein
MRRLLIGCFLSVLVAMAGVTVAASLERGVLDALAALWPDAWFRATLADAYFGFLTVWIWVAYRERGWIPRLAWLAAFLALGNLAMACYALLALRALPAGAPTWQALLRPEHRPASP